MPGSVQPSHSDKMQYTAEYYQQPPPESQQGSLLSYDIRSSPPSTVYYGGTYIAWSSFSGAFRGDSPLFWVLASGGWSWQAACPLGSWVRELIYVPKTGTLKVYEIYPSGITQASDLGWASAGYHSIWFNADVPGRHITIFTVSDNPSNAVVIDVEPYQNAIYQPGKAYPPDSGYASDGYLQDGYYASGYSAASFSSHTSISS